MEIMLPATASSKQLVRGYFEARSLYWKMAHYRLMRTQKVIIHNGFGNSEYVAALVDMKGPSLIDEFQGPIIILMHHESGGWWTKVFNTDQTRSAKNTEIACRDQETDKEFAKRVSRNTPKETVSLVSRIIQCSERLKDGLEKNGCIDVRKDEESLRQRYSANRRVDEAISRAESLENRCDEKR